MSFPYGNQRYDYSCPIQIRTNVRLNDPFELPSLEEIEEMERQRLQAIDTLEISGNSVKCQRCGHDIPIVGKLNRPYNDRVVILQRRIKWMENYARGSNKDDLEQLRQELAELLEEDAKADKLRSLPLYSCRITGWKFVCSKCYDKVNMLSAITKQRPYP
jgi:hypothetical protein